MNDFAAVLSSGAREQLTSLCAELNTKAHAQLIEVTVHSLENVPIEDFASQLFKKWGIGRKGESRGVLILLAVSDHKYRVEVGYGLEAILPDGKVGSFGREAVPLLRQNDYEGALLHIARQMAQVIAADQGITLTTLAPPPPPNPPPPPRPQPDSGNMGLLVVIVFMVVSSLVFAALVTLVTVVTTWRWFFGKPAARRLGWRALWKRTWGSMKVYSGGGTRSWSSGSFGGGGGSGGFGGASSGAAEGIGSLLDVASAALFGGGSSGGGGASGSW